MRNCLFLFLLIFSSYLAFGQKAITGTVKDARSKQPLPGVSVKIKGKNTGTVTNTDGTFQISASDGETIQISFVSYETMEVTVGDLSKLSIFLNPNTSELSEIVFVGTRSAGRAKTETAVPVDVLKVNQIGLPTAKMDLTSVLNYAAPSFNYNKQSGADGADHIDLGTLRGLGPDQTLVLINGKRRHQTAFVALFGTRGRGNSGVDLNAFPEASVDRIEILRDGASAQYGSDAIAGVINIILKKDINHWNVNAGWAGYYDKKFNAYQTRKDNQYYYSNPLDGNTFALSADNGFSVGKQGGYVNIAVDLLTQGKTYRQVADNDFSHPDALPLNTSRRAFGDASLASAGIMYNMEIPVAPGTKTVFYSFGGYNYKYSDAYAYTRNWSAKPERFPVDANGNLLYRSDIMHTAGDGEIYYNPHIQTRIQDASLAFGFKGATNSGWNWDLSNTLGRNDFNFFGDKTFNASNVGFSSPNHFNDGGFNFLQNTLNLDFSKSFRTVASGLNLGLGAEYRFERYSIYKGEFGSYGSYSTTPMVYPNLTSDSLRTPAPGSQGFPGFSTNDVVNSNRSLFAAYVDAELNLTRNWLLDGAIRIENYSDFGFVSTYKLATRYKVSEDFNIRGSVSSGYRAPSLQQINFSNTLTSFSGGVLIQSRIANNNDPITKAAGIPKLKQETSVNGSLGFSWKPTSGLIITIDGYVVKVKNRIVLSGLFSADDTTLPDAFTSQLKAIGVSTAQFFANAVSTTNKGIDIVVDYTKRWGKQSVKFLLAGNIQNMTVDEIHYPDILNDTKLHQKTFFSDREEAFLVASAPNSKFSLGLEYNMDKVGLGAHLTYFGKVVLLGFGDATADNPNQTGINPMVPTDADPNVLVPEKFNYNSKVTTDLYASYKFNKNITLFVGADNVFNVHPDLGVNPLARGWAFDNESGGPWDSVQMGFNGIRLFGKLALGF